MSAIEDALIAWAPMIESGYEVPAAGQVMREAAAELTRLRERNAELEAELDQAAGVIKDRNAELSSLEAILKEMGR